MSALHTQPPDIASKQNLFQSLRAEEEPLLGTCFVPPRGYEYLAGDTSVVVLGDVGSGKTALYKMLCLHGMDESGKPTRLLIEWRPQPELEKNKQNNLSVARRLTLQMLDACALTVVEHLTRFYPDFEQAPPWAQTRLLWFIRCSLQGDLVARLEPVFSGHQSLEPLTTKIQGVSPDAILYEPSPEQLIGELLTGLQGIGLAGIWIMADGFEGWAETEPEVLGFNLKAFFSALSLFEDQRLNFKFFIPAPLEPAMMRASGILRRRVTPYHLQRETTELMQIVERRLALTLGREQVSLRDVCEAPSLPEYLERVGHRSPREWLDQIQPLVQHYLESHPAKPIDEDTWKKLRRQYPPHFWMDEIGCNVRVGGREIPLDDVPPKTYNMLHYLYQHAGKVVSKEALYFLAYLGLDHIPRPGDEKYESPKEYSGLVDTSIYRLRQAIEPDPSAPIILQTVRGYGVRLVSRW